MTENQAHAPSHPGPDLPRRHSIDMSGDEDTNHPQSTIINTRLRACEPCKTRKVRCDKLDPCSACRSSNIRCWTARPTIQQKRPRTVAASQYEAHLEKINAQLSQLQFSIDSLGSRNTSTTPPAVHRAVDSIKHSAGTPNSSSSGSSPVPVRVRLPYLGESSFEVHSQQAGQILDKTLQNSPSSVLEQDVSASLRSLRTVASDETRNVANTFTTDLPLPPVQVVLAALQMIDIMPLGFFLCSPFMSAERFKGLCQKVFFPVNGYSMSDFIIVNGGLIGILGSATDHQRKESGIDPVEFARVFSMCCNNVTATIDKLSPFLEPTVSNIEAILFGVQVAMMESNHHLAWTLISFGARLCLDSGINRLKDNPDDLELNVKKVSFWFIYSLDKGLSLNFGRSPNLPDYDITITYPTFPPGPIADIAPLWFDIGKVQGKIYEKLYSAQGQLDTLESRAQTARILASELNTLRDRFRYLIDRMSEQEKEPFIDTEITIIANLTLVYRALPTHKPAHPLRFSDECIAVAREALNLHETICERFLSKMDQSIKMYIDWNLSICPFTPFIVVLGTAILDSNPDDMHLLENVVASLERAAVHAPGAKKLMGICKILLRGAKSCVEQSHSLDGGPIVAAVQRTAAAKNQAMVPNIPSQSQRVNIAGVAENGDQFWSTTLPDDWSLLQLDSTDNMSFLFDNYLAGNSSVLPIFESDLTRYDTM